MAKINMHKIDLNSELMKINYDFKKNKNHQTIIKFEKNHYKNYKMILHGINGLKKEELSQMSEQQKRLLHKKHLKAQRLINEIKQKRIIDLSNQFFESLFPKSSLTKQFLNYKETCPKMLNKFKFKDIGLKKTDIMSILFKENLL